MLELASKLAKLTAALRGLPVRRHSPGGDRFCPGSGVKKPGLNSGRQDLICWSASGLSVVARFGAGQEGRRPEARGGSLRLLWIARGEVHLWLVGRGMGRKQLTMLFMLYVHLLSLRQTKRLIHVVRSQFDPIGRGPLVHVPGSRSTVKDLLRVLGSKDRTKDQYVCYAPAGRHLY